ncbi:MAG: winged helix-turn-helix domain-containing protein [Thermomicrobia bacterium]|nr:winged helix-turn-helix domain-containing protein [Thermomicrobia bacterium]
MVLGEARAITTGFPSGIEAEGWQWDEAPDMQALLSLALPPRMVIVLLVPACTLASVATIRQLTSALALPVVVFSPECAPAIVEMTLQAGADDFLPVPVMIEEMVARLAAVIRVHFGAQDDRSRSDYRLDEAAHLVSIVGGAPIHLSVSEYRLFRMLFAARNRPVARERLATIPLLHAELDGQNALDAVVSRLRRKLGTERIVTIRGIGYQLVDHRQPPPNVSYLHHAARVQ